MDFAVLSPQEPTVSLGSLFDLKEQIRQATDIVDLVGRHIQLKRQGRNYVGLCPWHDDSRPSFQVNPERQSFKCWVCDLGGDVFSFVMKIEGVDFPEALAMLAERAGIALKPQQPTSASSGKPAAPGADKRSLYAAMAWAEEQYHRCLTELPEGEPGRRYLAERAITQQSVAGFHLGYSPEAWDWIVRRAEQSSINPRLLETVGVLARSAGSGRLYDRFRGRVLFSIRDVQSRPVGIGGRVLPGPNANTSAKYVNSPETPLYSKSHLLYGLDVALETIRRQKGVKTVLVMEGYTDCIVAHQYGFTNAVAVLGTALGEGHLRLLKRFADRVVLILDGDDAGQKRTNEVLELFVAQQVDLRIVTLPTEKDPCDFLLKHGTEALENLIARHAVDALEHAFRSATRGIDLDRDVHAATQALDYLVRIIARAPRQRDDTTRDWRVREEKIIQRMAASFRIDENVVRGQLTELRRRQRPSWTAPALRGGAPGEQANEEPLSAGPIVLDAFERELLELLLQFPHCIPAAQSGISAARLGHPVSRRLFETCCRLAEADVVPSFERLMLEFDDPAIKNLLVDLDEHGRAKGGQVADPLALLQELLGGFAKREIEKRRPAELSALRDGRLDEGQGDELLRNIIAAQRARQGTSKPTDG